MRIRGLVLLAAFCLAGCVWCLAGHGADETGAWTIVARGGHVRAVFLPEGRQLGIAFQETAPTKREALETLWLASLHVDTKGLPAMVGKQQLTKLVDDGFRQVLRYGDGRLGVLFVHNMDGILELRLTVFRGEEQHTDVLYAQHFPDLEGVPDDPCFVSEDLVVGMCDPTKLWMVQCDPRTDAWTKPRIFGEGLRPVAFPAPEVSRVFYIRAEIGGGQWVASESHDKAALLRAEAEQGRYWDEVYFAAGGRVQFIQHDAGPVESVPLPTRAAGTGAVRLVPGTDRTHDFAMVHPSLGRLALLATQRDGPRVVVSLFASADGGVSWSAPRGVLTTDRFVTRPIVAVHDSRVWLGVIQHGQDEEQLLVTTVPAELLWPK